MSSEIEGDFEMAFRVRPMQAQTVGALYDERDQLDLEPSYQRRGQIWSTRQKQGLIDTILNDFDIPKLYFADFTFINGPLNHARKRYAVIDGKQRLLAIFGFFSGEFSLSSSFIFGESPSTMLGGMTYTDLLANYPRLARKFSNLSLAIMSVETDDESKINELFIRLNTSKPLVGAEIRNAMPGKVPSLIRELSEHLFWQRVRFSLLRGQDKNTAAKLLLLEHNGGFIDTKKRQLDRLVEHENHPKISPSDEYPSQDRTDAVVDREFPTVDETETDIADATDEAESSNIESSATRVRKVLNVLYPLFINRDEMLTQQAQIPLIYFLARDMSEERLVHLRSFLLQFEQDRILNRQKRVDDATRDQELFNFEFLSRNSNDQSSISSRYQIMRSRFEKSWSEKA